MSKVIASSLPTYPLKDSYIVFYSHLSLSFVLDDIEGTIIDFLIGLDSHRRRGTEEGLKVFVIWIRDGDTFVFWRGFALRVGAVVAGSGIDAGVNFLFFCDEMERINTLLVVVTLSCDYAPY